VLAAAVFVLLAQKQGTVDGHDYSEMAWVVVEIAAGIFVIAFVLTSFRQRVSQAIQSALAWVAIAFLLAVGYTYRFELRDVADRVLAEFVPGRASGRANVVEIARERAGSFAVVTQVNDARVAMVLDTGATSIVLTQEAAKAAGLPLEVLTYSINVETANGRARAAPVTLDRVAIGGIVERAVPALIAQPGQLRSNLLGMSFLNRLESWEVRGDRLVMRGYP
jgi:aspartyl protease family protein